MTTERLQVSIVAAPIAALDRRALSQAWYSALHLERKRTRAIASPPPRLQTGTRAGSAAQLGSTHTPVTHAANVRELKRSANHPLQPETASGVARTATMRSISPLSRRIERTFSRSGGQVRRATFSLGRGGARVHVILQSNAGTVTLVALCRPEMREVVARALARARLALTARGFHVALPVNGEAPCF